MFWNGLWLVLVIYLVGTAAIQAALWALGVSAAVKLAVALLIAILVGCEAGSLRRWSLRRRWTNVGSWWRPVRRRRNAASSSRGRPMQHRRRRPLRRLVQSTRMPEPSPDVIGLFPEPQPRP